MAPLEGLPPGCEAYFDLETIQILEGLLNVPKKDDALDAYYTDFLERHDRRPTAMETFHDGYSPKSARKVYGSWLGFVDHRGGLDAFLAKAKDEELSDSALKVKKEIAKAQVAAA